MDTLRQFSEKDKNYFAYQAQHATPTPVQQLRPNFSK